MPLTSPVPVTERQTYPAVAVSRLPPPSVTTPPRSIRHLRAISASSVPFAGHPARSDNTNIADLLAHGGRLMHEAEQIKQRQAAAHQPAADQTLKLSPKQALGLGSLLLGAGIAGQTPWHESEPGERHLMPLPVLSAGELVAMVKEARAVLGQDDITEDPTLTRVEGDELLDGVWVQPLHQKDKKKA